MKWLLKASAGKEWLRGRSHSQGSDKLLWCDWALSWGRLQYGLKAALSHGCLRSAIHMWEEMMGCKEPPRAISLSWTVLTKDRPPRKCRGQEEGAGQVCWDLQVTLFLLNSRASALFIASNFKSSQAIFKTRFRRNIIRVYDNSYLNYKAFYFHSLLLYFAWRLRAPCWAESMRCACSEPPLELSVRCACSEPPLSAENERCACSEPRARAQRL
jgi:hypothetical protein